MTRDVSRETLAHGIPMVVLAVLLSISPVQAGNSLTDDAPTGAAPIPIIDDRFMKAGSCQSPDGECYAFRVDPSGAIVADLTAERRQQLDRIERMLCAVGRAGLFKGEAHDPDAFEGCPK